MSRNRGHDRERQWVKRKRAAGWWAMRAPASLGAVDVVAIHPDEGVEFIEMKSTAGGPYERFGPAERARLLAEATLAGARALLVWWPPNKQPVEIPSSDWP